MNARLRSIQKKLEQNKKLTTEEKKSLIRALEDVDEESGPTTPELQRTEKGNKTAATLLKETTEELQQKSKALEARDRELEIETSLDRVRNCAMAMHHSDELAETAQVLFQQFSELGENPDQLSIGIMNETEKALEIWLSVQGVRMDRMFKVSIKEPIVINKIYAAWKKRKKSLVLDISGSELKKYNDFRNGLPEFKEYNVVRTRKSKEENRRVIYCAFFPKGLLSVATPEPRPAETLKLLERFAGVFDLTYTRFLDLKKAEAQAREAQIEAALERVRSRTMAMHRSDELSEASTVLFEQLQNLGIHPIRCAFVIADDNNKSLEMWGTASEGKKLGTYKLGTIPKNKHPIFKKAWIAWEAKKSDFLFTIKGKSLESFHEVITSSIVLSKSAKKKLPSSSVEYHYNAIFKYGTIAAVFDKSPEKSIQLVIQRFTRVFEQTYTRFLDLQKAEAQAREAQIEAALERVRSRTMGMHSSDELSEAGSMVFQQMNELGIQAVSSWFWFINLDNDQIEIWTTHEDHLGKAVKVNAKDFWTFKEELEAWKRKEPFYKLKLPQNDFVKLLNGIFGIKVRLDNSEEHIHLLQTYHKYGFLGLGTRTEATDEEMEISARFAKVFEQTYTRFLDLQKAEAQAREAQIEAALERVRSQSMGMHKSNELVEVVRRISKEIMDLGIHADYTQIFTDFSDNPTEGLNSWIAVEGQNYLEKMHFPFPADQPITLKFFEAIDKGLDFFSEKYSKSEKNLYFRFFFKHSDLKKIPNERKDLILSAPGWARSTVMLKNSCLHFGRYSLNEFSEEEEAIFKRLGNVFGQAYTRFLDLQKAEAQAREAQIEAALERVRSRTMGMQKSEELKEVIQLVYEQFVHLKINVEHTGFIMDYKARDDMHIWLADQNEIPSEITIPCFDSPPNNSFKEAKEKGKDFFIYLLTFKEKNKFYRDLFKFIPGVPEESLEYYFNCLGLAGSGVLLENVGLYIENFSGTPYSDEDNNTLMRFGKVFQQTYTRFLDLQKAEAQAREAQIEAALEGIRARTMAMHKSDELAETAAILFQQMTELGVTPERLNICLIKEEDNILEVWATDQQGIKISHHFNARLDEPTTGKRVYDAWKEKKRSVVIDLSGKELNDWIRYVREVMGMTIKAELVREHRIHSVAFFSQGMILTTTPEPLPKESIKLLERFADVFNLTYRRFLDLQKAEAQAREAQIEAALERVRSKTMAMHNSQEVGESVVTLFDELTKLGLDELALCGIGIMHDQYLMEAWTASKTNKAKAELVIGHIDMRQHALLLGAYEGWQTKKESFQYVLEGDDKINYFNIISNQADYIVKRDIHTLPPTIVLTIFYFKEGCLYAFSSKELSPETTEIFKRFTGVFGQTYRRYLDLQMAEAQAGEAVKQASLDRVRGEIASMRTSDDLNRITPIIWRELETLEVPFIRCGVFIVDEENEKVQVYLTTPDGKSLGVLNLPFDANEITANTVDHWKKNRVYKEHWNREEFIDWTKSLIEIGQVQNAKTYQGSSNPPESLDLHFVPFTQGMLYVGNPSSLTDEKLGLVKTLAEAFSIAYARYEDFKNLEEAKNKIEVTLNELKSAQAQLIHSEKMASLGELTAGIAHEIKNPLNFVNNFSELSIELLDEMKDELKNDNKEDALDIADDVKQNLDKINQHGKRADSVVKGMLLHSRGSSGEKMLTDVNELLDQYVNLAYHGMRALDKDFNIAIEKDYDESIEKISVVPQDIGRAFLNVISNACYAANQRKKKNENDFTPKLKISSKNLDDKIKIRILDNGNGIPADILDKIFQPFFTTKPTGEGTGLGLSLSYDIVVKQHGGKLEIESIEGEGAEFIIQLPA